MRSRGVGARINVEPVQTPRASKKPFDSTPSIAPGSTFRATKPTKKVPLNTLSRDFENSQLSSMSLRRLEGACSSQPSEEARKYPRRCVWCDEETEY